MVKKEKSKKKRLSECKFYLLPFAVCLAALPALSAPLQNWRYDPKSNQLEVTVKPGVKPRYKFAAYPARIILELPNTEVGQVKRQESYQGAVRQIRVSQAASGMAQVVLILAPNTMLSRDQAQLQQVSERNKYSDRWVLRPLLAGTTNTASIARFSTRKPTASPGLSSPPRTYPPGMAPNELPPAPSVSTGPRVTVPPINASRPATSTGLSSPPRTYPPGMAPNELPPAPSMTTGSRVTVPPINTPRLPASPSATPPTPPSPDQFPPGLSSEGTRVGQPGTIVVTAKPDTSAPSSRTEVVSQAPQKPEAQKPEAQKPEIVSQAPSNGLRLSAVNPSFAIPDSLPPISAQAAPTAPTVSVPPLQRATPTSTKTVLPAALPPTLNEASTSAGLPPTLNEAAAPPSASQPTIVAKSGTIDFGQPLPTREAYTAQNYEQSYGTPPPRVPPSVSLTSSTPGVVLPAGTVVNVRYPGSSVLKLQANKPRQEVLLLQNEIRDRAGNLIIPLGSQIYGRFETNRFVAQSIVIQGRPFPFVAQSDPLNGTRQVSDRALIRNSGIGAVAGALLGGLSGGTVVGGAAVGAGITYATAPKPATIQPGQIFQVQLTEDLR